ncbi:MAG: acyltransferase [Deltaproteobacteria bacterium]|nr:acyltransferase [Deltaproteobacteria bacterium]
MFCGYTQKIKIGKGCYIGAFCNIRALHEEIIIGDYCLIAQFVSIIGANHKIDQPRITDKVEDHVSKKIVIGDNVWIGVNVVILPGVTIGDGAVVGAGSVVTKDIPPYYISAGVPAKVIRKRQLD